MPQQTNVVDTCAVRRSPVLKSTGTIGRKTHLETFPYIITQRCFAPWKRFGDLFGINNSVVKDKRFHGDNRGFSLLPWSRKKESGHVTARVGEECKVTINKDGIVYDRPFASETTGWASLGVVLELPVPFELKKTSKVHSDANFFDNLLYMHVSGSNPLVYPAPDLSWDITTRFTLRNKGSVRELELNCRMSGKGYPAYEAFIADGKNTKVFLFTIPAPHRNKLATELLNPLHDVVYENTLWLEVDQEGNFIGPLSVDNADMHRAPMHGLNRVGRFMNTNIKDWNSYNSLRKPAPDCAKDECR